MGPNPKDFCLHQIATELANMFFNHRFLQYLGKQKFEVLLIQFPNCPSSSTFDNRIMQRSCNDGKFVACIDFTS